MSLADLRPDLIEFWSDKNEYSPWEVSTGSSYRTWWICPIHGEYEQTCANKYMGKGCKKCSDDERARKQSVASYEKSLGYLYPDLVKEWSEKNDKTPFEVYLGSHYKAIWVCPKHGEFISKCYNRTNKKKTNCPECWEERRGRALAKPNSGSSLGDLYPELVREWSNKNDHTPFEVKRGSDYKAKWICKECGLEWEASCYNRSKLGSGCPKCGRERSRKSLALPKPFHSFADLYPDLLKEYSPENDRNPYSLRPGSHELVQWMCKKEHTWTAHVYARTGSWKTGCPHCSDKSKTENSLRAAFTQYGAEDFEHKLGKWNVDIYFPDSKTVIEYDGSRWHSFSGAWDRDRRKSLELLEKGYTVIRIRTWSNNYKLESLNIDNENYTEVFCKEPKDSVPSEELVEELSNILRNF